MRLLAAFLFLLAGMPFVFAETASVEIKGVALNSSKAPVDGATVWLSQDRDVQKTTSKSDGSFSFPKALRQAADIVVWKDGLAIGGAGVGVPGVEAVTIILGEPDSLRIWVKTPAFDPVAGARIKYLFVNDAFEIPVEDLAELGFPFVRSDDDGHLKFPDLPKDGHVRFIVAHRSWAETTVPYLPVGGKEQTVVLYPGFHLRGRITAVGRTVSPSGRTDSPPHEVKGIARARVSAIRQTAGAPDVTETLTDPEGFYNMLVKRGDCYVAVRHPDFASPEPKAISVEADEEKNVVDLVLPSAHVIEGSVVFPDAKPCIGAPVSYWIGKSLYQETFSQFDGKFVLTVPDIDGHIRVAPPDGFMTENLNDIAVAKPQPHTRISPIRLLALPAIEGVVHGEDGSGQPNVLISSLDLKPAVWFITDADGKFKFQLRQLPSELKASFRAEHADHLLRGEFSVTFKDLKPVDVKLQPFEPDLGARQVEKGQNALADLIGKPAPELACGKWIQGGPTTLEALKGKVVVLTFWGGFDERMDAVDHLEELRALFDWLHGADDVAFLSVHDAGSDDDEIKQFIKAWHIPYPVARDTDTFQTFTEYTIRYIPQTVLIDKHGILRFFQVDGRLPELIKALRREG